MPMRYQFVLWCLCFSIVSSIQSTSQLEHIADYNSIAFDHNSNSKNWKIIRTHHRKNCNITYVMDEFKRVFLIKQYKNTTPLIKQFLVVTEMLGAYIAEVNGIQANKVSIIPAECAFPVKLNRQKPATLHALVPGQKVSTIYDFNLLFKLLLSRRLTSSVMHSMSLRKDIPVIVALDTFIGNNDRNRGNFFYDKETDTFWLIDFGNSFKRIISSSSCTFINEMLGDKSLNLVPEEINGLIIYRDTLKKLIESHPPKQLHTLFDIFTKQAGIIPGSVFYNDEVAERIQWYKNNIIENYQGAQELVKLLDKLIACQVELN